jgi:hypothetical protein
MEEAQTEKWRRQSEKELGPLLKKVPEPDGTGG